jgi:acetyltransferase
MGGPDVAAGEDILNRAGIPTFAFPDTAARMFTYLWRYTYNLRGLYETPTMHSDQEPDRDAADRLISSARAAGRTLLSEFESKELLTAYGIPTVPTQVASDPEQAVEAAERFGYPVVLKLHSLTISHKTDVGGVMLNLRDRAAVEAAFARIREAVTASKGAAAFVGVSVQPMIRADGAYEIILGSSLDPAFGPVLLFGTGGQLVEIYKDRSLALPPLNATLARRMMEQTKIYSALKGVRGRKPVDLNRLEQLLVQFSHLVVEQRWIKEIDINPLLVSADTIVALDARVVLHDADVVESQLPPLAIRPYPLQYVRPWTTRDGMAVTIRPIRPEDEPLLVEFHRTLSEQSVRQRYFGAIKLEQRTSHERLTRVCFNDYNRELALVVERDNKTTDRPEIVAVGRLSRIPNTNDAELALLVSDAAQHCGLGSQLAYCLVSAARLEKMSNLHAEVMAENLAMQRILQKSGFVLGPRRADATMAAELPLG